LLDKVPKQKRKRLFASCEEVLEGEERLWPFFRTYVESHPEEFFRD
jgi:hypothetical protein